MFYSQNGVGVGVENSYRMIMVQSVFNNTELVF